MNNFEILVIFLENYWKKEVVIWFCYSYLGVVFPELLLHWSGYLKNFDLFPCTGEKICLVFCLLVVDLIFLVVFVCIQQSYVHIRENNYTKF